ncbi:MAG TPA: response regulator [Gemmatimonadales bacterium]|nr:response regulator [Gemmatimonadales bacterium]
MTASPAARLRHDLRTPVNHILGYGEMLLEDAEATGRAGRAASLARILNLAREMIVVIDGPATVRQLGDSLRAPASRTIAELERLRDSGTSLGAAEAADLRRIADAAGLLLRFADEGAVVFGGDRAASEVAAGGNPEPQLLGRVLIVDDDPANRELLGRRVEREGCAAVLAAGGAEALALLDADGFDLVLLDLVMPVLIFSALDEQGSVARCIEAGAEDYLPKGVDPVLLRARMGACLRKKRARDQELAYLRDVRVLTAGAAALRGGGDRGGRSRRCPCRGRGADEDRRRPRGAVPPRARGPCQGSGRPGRG